MICAAAWVSMGTHWTISRFDRQTLKNTKEARWRSSGMTYAIPREKPPGSLLLVWWFSSEQETGSTKAVDDDRVQLDEPVEDETQQELLSMKAKVLASVTATGLGLFFATGLRRWWLEGSSLAHRPATGTSLCERPWAL